MMGFTSSMPASWMRISGFTSDASGCASDRESERGAQRDERSWMCGSRRGSGFGMVRGAGVVDAWRRRELGIGNFRGWLQSRRQNVSDGGRGLVDAQQRGKRCRDIDRLNTIEIDAGGERRSVEAQRNMAIERIRREGGGSGHPRHL